MCHEQRCYIQIDIKSTRSMSSILGQKKQSIDALHNEIYCLQNYFQIICGWNLEARFHWQDLKTIAEPLNWQNSRQAQWKHSRQLFSCCPKSLVNFIWSTGEKQYPSYFASEQPEWSHLSCNQHEKESLDSSLLYTVNSQ